jgi:hypothetical protein
MATAPVTGKPLIESDRVEGTTVYDPAGNNIGSIKRLMIEKLSGRVAYSVMSFGGFLGMGSEEHPIPWSKLTYDTCLGGYRTDVTENRLRGTGPIGIEKSSCRTCSLLLGAAANIDACATPLF